LELFDYMLLIPLGLAVVLTALKFHVFQTLGGGNK